MCCGEEPVALGTGSAKLSPSLLSSHFLQAADNLLGGLGTGHAIMNIAVNQKTFRFFACAFWRDMVEDFFLAFLASYHAGKAQADKSLLRKDHGVEILIEMIQEVAIGCWETPSQVAESDGIGGKVYLGKIELRVGGHRAMAQEQMIKVF